MRSQLSSRSRSRSTTSPVLPALAALAALAAGCNGEEQCGPADAADDVTLAVGGEPLAFGEFHSSPNNDCPPPEGGPTSLTVTGLQVDPAAQRAIVLCLPRPDQIGSDPVALDDADLVQVVDVNGQDAAGCLLSLDRSRAIEGSAAFSGYGDGGAAPAGCALASEATVPLTRLCGEEESAVTATLAGTAAVIADQI